MKLTQEKIEEIILEELIEATGEQKRQQKRDNYLSREKQRRKIKARKSNNTALVKQINYRRRSKKKTW